ncbi:MAG: hypothetical protein GY859_18340 [Desulfobacterales bacterium]|nr:hypothetical protein [Desulfobacterales bacterium]
MAAGAGAGALDINTGSLSREPEESMAFFVEAVQAVTDLPLAKKYDVEMKERPTIQISSCANHGPTADFLQGSAISRSSSAL